MDQRCSVPAADGVPELAPPSGSLRRLVAAECAAEAAAAGEDPQDLQQAVWLRWLEAGPAAGGAAEAGTTRTAGTRAAPGARARSGAPAAAGAAAAGADLAGAPSAWWLRRAVRAEARRARRRARREGPLPWGGPPFTPSAEAAVLAAEQRRLLAAAVARLPGPCPALMRALFSRRDLTYPEIAGELGMSQGSLGPVRSRCLGCLRTMLAASDCGT